MARPRGHSWVRSNILGLVAIFIALSGSAIATRTASETSDDQRSASVAAKKKKPKPGPAGPAGPQGPQGPAGPPGALAGTISGGPGGQLLDNTVDNADLAPNAEFSGTQVPAGDLMGSFYPSPTLAANSVGVSEIGSDSVGFDELAPSSVGSLEVNDAALALQDLVVDSGFVDVIPADPAMSNNCLIETTGNGHNVDANDYVLTSLPVDSASILVTTGSINSGGGGSLDVTVCNPISTVVASPATVNWAVVEVP